MDLFAGIGNDFAVALSPWNIPAGVLLVEEAGGRVTDFFGGRTYLETGHVVVTNGLLHDWMLEGIASVFPRDLDYSKRS